MRDFYEPVSKYYDRLSSVYSLGKIPRCRNAFVAEICKAVRIAGAKEVRVCLVGVGHGAEAIAMAECGAHITVVDRSESMLDMFRKKLSRVSDETMARVNIIHDNVRNIEHQYDWVVANFFLNVFPESQMEEKLGILIEKCSDEGQIVIGDFYYDADGSWVVRVLQKVNWRLALIIFRMFVKNADHAIYIYSEGLRQKGWNLKAEHKFGLLGVNFYQSAKYCKDYGEHNNWD